MIVNFKHNIEDSNQRPPTEPASDLIRTDSKNVGRDLSEKIASELVDQNKLEADYKFQLLNPDANLTNQVDDGSIHKFASIQFNDIVICEFCNKKVWKNLILILGFKKFKPNLKWIFWLKFRRQFVYILIISFNCLFTKKENTNLRMKFSHELLYINLNQLIIKILISNPKYAPWIL